MFQPMLRAKTSTGVGKSGGGGVEDSESVMGTVA